jgi:putative transposase
LLDVSRSGFDKWLKRGVSKREERRLALLKEIEKIFEESNRTYGSPRVHAMLERNGIRVNIKTVENLMKEHHITPPRKKKFRVTTDSKHDLPIAENLVNRQFDGRKPDEVWVSDITYIHTNQGWLFLSVFIDLCTRKIVGWSMGENITTDLVLDSFRMGVSNRECAPDIAHSDRGVQYASDAFRAELSNAGSKQSMSRKGNCWDNAVSESFFGALKTELIHRYAFESQKHAEVAIFEYIEIFYNKRRLHSALGYLTPEEKGLKGEKAA